jgi:hemoglobin-like flavoprotein
MTPQQIQIVQSTWAKVVPIAPTATALFYGRLFELDPALKPLFRNNMEEQGRKLATMIDAAVAGLTQLDRLVPTVQELGRRHVGYGVSDKDYDTVGAALLWTLEKGLGDDFTPVAKEAWTLTYTTLAKVMKDAAAEVPA